MTLVSVSDKEKLVMKLLEEDKNFQEISKKAHVSFRFISTINKKRLGRILQLKEQLSIPSQALKLFSEGKSLIRGN